MTFSQTELEALWREYGRDLHRFLRVLGADHADADDLVQEVLLYVARHPFERRSPGETAMYLRATAKSLYIKFAQRSKRVIAVDLATIEAEYAQAVGDDSESAVEALKRCIAALPERERLILDLRYTRNASREEMGAALNLSDGGVKNLLERVKQKLKECLERRRQRQA